MASCCELKTAWNKRRGCSQYEPICSAAAFGDFSELIALDSLNDIDNDAAVEVIEVLLFIKKKKKKMLFRKFYFFKYFIFILYDRFYSLYTVFKTL